jgi:hypothetical protein
VLREHGFAGSGQDFHRRIDGNWAAINVQRARYSTADDVGFTVNLGTASTAVRVEEGFAADDPAREIDCHWRLRIGALLPGGQDTWWTVRSGMLAVETEILGTTLAGHLVELAIPELERMAPDEAILATVLDGEPRPGLPPATMDVVGPILRRIGPPERFARWLAILDEPADGESAAALYSLMDALAPRRMGEKRIQQRLERLSSVGFEPRQQAIMDLGSAPADDRIIGAVKPALDDGDWRIRFAAAEALGRLGHAPSAPRLASMVRDEPVRMAAVHAAFALVRLDPSLDAVQRADDRSAIRERHQRAVGHDRAALAHVLRSLEP